MATETIQKGINRVLNMEKSKTLAASGPPKIIARTASGHGRLAVLVRRLRNGCLRRHYPRVAAGITHDRAYADRDSAQQLLEVAPVGAATGCQHRRSIRFIATLSATLDLAVGDVNGDARIEISDFGFFALAYLSPANYKAALDYNGDGRIDIADFGQFSVRFVTSLA